MEERYANADILSRSLKLLSNSKIQNRDEQAKVPNMLNALSVEKQVEFVK